METFVDNLWESIEHYIALAAVIIDRLLAPLSPAGPELMIFTCAFVTVLAVTLFKKVYTTRRYRELKENFEHWQAVREEAMAHEDREKGKAIAKNIDQAELNRAYYDFFFEGLMKSMITTWLPLLSMLAYVNTSFSPHRLKETFGTATLIHNYLSGSSPMWYVICVIVSFVLVALFRSMYKKRGLRRPSCCCS